MKEIADELQVIATNLGVDYLRAASLSDSNIITHYTEITADTIIYTGYGNIGVSFSGAIAVKAVDATVYIVNKAPTTDELAEDIDLFMQSLETVATSIVNQFTALQPILEYTLEPVTIHDDMLRGYLLTFSPELATNGC